MPSHLPPSARPSSMPWGFVLAALSLLLVGGGLMVWAHQEPSPAPAGSLAAAPELPPIPAHLGRPDASDARPFGVHSITLTRENGARVVKILVVPGGDEIIVDAASGKLIETRPTRSMTAPGAKVSSAT